MDSHNDLLGELAGDAALERADFLVQSTEQLRKFLDHHRDRIATIGGLTLIDEEPDYLSVAPDLTFRSRSRYLDDTTGEWVSETEVIESASELVELYNPADIYAAFARGRARGRRDAAEPTAERRLLETAGISPEETVGAAARTRTPRPPTRGPPASPMLARPRTTTSPAARRLYDLALEYQERQPAQRGAPARAVRRQRRPGLISVIGDLVIVDDDDERLMLDRGGHVPGRGRSPRMPRRPGGRSTGPTSWSSSTTRPTSSATSPTPSPRPIPSVAPELERAGAGGGRRTRPRRRGRRRRTRPTTAGETDEDEPTA